MVDVGLFRIIGGGVIWILKGFKGSFSDVRDSRYSAIIGLGFIFFVIITYGLIAIR